MVVLKGFWNAFKNLAILLSFVMNFVLIVILLIVLQQIFTIKSGILQPLVTGLHSSFVGLGEARIITTIQVSDTVPVKLDIPLDTTTTVTLTNDVPLRVPAAFTLGDGTTLRGTVSITLPTDTQLPVSLKLNVPVDSTLPITLNVPVDIALKDTQLNDVANKLEGLFDPLVRLVGNLPNSWDEAMPWIGNILAGNAPDIWAPNQFTNDPWPGFTTGNPALPPQATIDPNTGVIPPANDGQPTPTLSVPTLEFTIVPDGEIIQPTLPVAETPVPTLEFIPLTPTPAESEPSVIEPTDVLEVSPTAPIDMAVGGSPEATFTPEISPTPTSELSFPTLEPTITPSMTPTPTLTYTPSMTGTPIRDLGIITATPRP
ncbi:MAG: hypothetical protein U0528_15690 [Anaerolineae bacterium]|nr:hypothetical protein [Anaerolineae bacterium]